MKRSLLRISGVMITLSCAQIGMMTNTMAQEQDTIPPETIMLSPVIISVGDEQVTIQWEALKDNVGVVAYKVYYSEHSYLSKSQQADPKSQFTRFKRSEEHRVTIENLKNDTPYFFTVTGLDQAGNESEFVAAEAMAKTSHTTALKPDGQCESDEDCKEGAFCYWIADGPKPPLPVEAIEEGRIGDGQCHQRCHIAGSKCMDEGTCIEIGRECTGDVCARRELVCSTALPLDTPASPSPSPTPSPPIPASPEPSAPSPPAPSPVITATDFKATWERITDTYDEYNVHLSWTMPAGVKDVITQALYSSMNDSAFGKLALLLPTATTFTIEHLQGGKYTFKLTTIETGNAESEGILASITLPPSGPALIGLALISMGMALRRVIRKGRKST